MLSQSVLRSLVVVFLLLSLTGCLAKVYDVRPPSPQELRAISNPLPATPESTINVPVQLDLSTFLDTVNNETVVPKKFDHWGSYIKNPKSGDYKYYAERDEFVIDPSSSYQSNGTPQGTALRDWWKGVEPSGSRLSINAPLRAKIGTSAHGHCGEGNEGLRRGALNGHLAIGLSPQYGMTASVNSVTAGLVDSCKLGAVEGEVTQEVKTQLTERVKIGLSQATSRLTAMTIKPQVEDVWNTLRKPIPLEPDSWLLLNVDKVKHSGFSVSGHIADDVMHVTAKPVIVVGTEPSATTTALPLFDSQAGSTEDYGTVSRALANRLMSTGFHVVADAPLDYAELSKSLTSRLRGRRVEQDGNLVKIVAGWIYGNGGNQVVLRIDIAGDANGHLYMVGTPEMNLLTQSVYIGGLQYDRATEVLLGKTASWILRTSLRELVASEAVLGVSLATDRVRTMLTKALDRTMSPTVSIHGTIDSVQGIGVFADTKELHVRTMMDGTLDVTVSGNKP